MRHLAPVLAAEDPVRREYPERPIVGVAGVVLHGTAILLIQRGREPMRGAWSLPGGALELGETTAEGAAREVWEETGIRVRPVSLIATLDRIVRNESDAVQYHYVLVDWLCEPLTPELSSPVCGDDALDARWVSFAELPSYNLPGTTLDIIERGRIALAQVQ